jgi:hypothetical protein
LALANALRKIHMGTQQLPLLRNRDCKARHI